jgi:hypothetical protein
LEIKCLGEQNTLIDKNEFVFKGQDQMGLIRLKMENTKKIARTFKVFEIKDPQSYRFYSKTFKNDGGFN